MIEADVRRCIDAGIIDVNSSWKLERGEWGFNAEGLVDVKNTWIEPPELANANVAPNALTAPNTAEWGVQNINAPAVWASRARSSRVSHSGNDRYPWASA